MESFQIVLPSPTLAPYIRHYWLLETDSVARSTERIIPCGNIQMLFYRGNPVSLSSRQDTRRLDSQSVLCGQFVGFSDLSYTGNIKILAVVFHTYAANAFFRIPVSEFCDRKVTAGEAGDRDLLELEDRLLYEAEDRNCIRLVEQFLLRRLNPLKSYNLERMRSVISTIDREKGEIRVSDLASSVFLSTKQFQRVFTGHIGISPKDFLRIVRFPHALYMLQSVPGMTFSRLACECGFYDQPHLISEFKIFSGYTPKEYLSLCAPYSDYFSTEND